MDYSITAKELIQKLGGGENISSLTHCMTRLRFILNDESIVDDSAVSEIPGVLGVVRNGVNIRWLSVTTLRNASQR